MATRTHEPTATNMLGDALGESRQHFRKLVQSLDRLVAADRLDEGRSHLPKLEALAKELQRLLNPRDPVDRKVRAQINRDLLRIQKAMRKGWGGAVGTGLLAVILGSVFGVAALIGIFWLAFT
jgi:hypothetical protein